MHFLELPRLNRQLRIKSSRLLKALALSLIMLLFNACKQKPETTGHWYKGNLHTHSYWSDGDEFPEMIMQWYKSRGYQFIALSDHNILAEGEKWKLLPKSKIYETAFENYLQAYGKDWVDYRQDTGRTSVRLKTYPEYKPLFEEPGKFLIIQSEEISDGFEGKPIHLCATNVKTLIDPQHGASVAETLQNDINAVLKQRKETGQPMIVHINHPNFGWGISLEDIEKLRGERFFEVFNGHPSVRNYGNSAHIGTEEMWDQINITYLNRNQPLMYGVATDDTHNYHLFGTQYSNAGRGWVMVRADSLNPKSLIKSLENGQFYASTGVALDDVSFEDNVLEVKINEDPGVNYKVQFIGVKRNADHSEVLAIQSGRMAQFKVTDDLLFVRTKIISDKMKENPFHEGDAEVAWTQPVVYE